MNIIQKKLQQAYLRNKTGLDAIDIPVGVRQVLSETKSIYESCTELSAQATKFCERAQKMAEVSPPHLFFLINLRLLAWLLCAALQVDGVNVAESRPALPIVAHDALSHQRHARQNRFCIRAIRRAESRDVQRSV